MQVQFLNSEQFEALPYSKVATSLGVADRNTGIAYVRDTASPLDVFTAMHELEHLRGDDLHEHETEGEPGVYYKDFGQTLMTVAPIALGMFGGPLLGGLGSALSGVGGGIASGLGAISPALGGAASSIGGALGGAGNAIGGALGIGGGSPNVIKTGGDVAMKGFAPSAGRIGAGFAGPGGEAAYASQTPRVLSSIGQSGFGSSLAGGAKKAAGSFASDATSGLAQNLLGGNGGNMMGGFMNPGEGSQTPQTNAQPNQIAGQSGEGSQGGAGGAPGSAGGGAISKLKAYLQQSQGGEDGGAF